MFNCIVFHCRKAYSQRIDASVLNCTARVPSRDGGALKEHGSSWVKIDRTRDR
jgi:hypothetical protein